MSPHRPPGRYFYGTGLIKILNCIWQQFKDAQFYTVPTSKLKIRLQQIYFLNAVTTRVLWSVLVIWGYVNTCLTQKISAIGYCILFRTCYISLSDNQLPHDQNWITADWGIVWLTLTHHYIISLTHKVFGSLATKLYSNAW